MRVSATPPKPKLMHMQHTSAQSVIVTVEVLRLLHLNCVGGRELHSRAAVTAVEICHSMQSSSLVRVQVPGARVIDPDGRQYARSTCVRQITNCSHLYEFAEAATIPLSSANTGEAVVRCQECWRI